MVAEDTEAIELVQEDDFTGPEGSEPNDTMWMVYAPESDDYVRIDGNTLRTHVVDEGTTYIRTRVGVEVNDLAILVDWQPRTTIAHAGSIALYKDDGGGPVEFLEVFYGGGGGISGRGWALSCVHGGYWRSYFSYQLSATSDMWYVWNITIISDIINITVKEKVSGDIAYSWYDVPIDTLEGEVMCQIGAYSEEDHRDTSSNWDNYRFYDLSKEPNIPPAWHTLPLFEATEDVSITYDFTNNITDVDDVVEDLSITSTSPYVTETDGLKVTFLFPNGVMDASVPLVLRDGVSKAVADVNFTIEPVNDAPSEEIPNELSATEDIPLVIDLSPCLSDVDNATEDLKVLVDDPYAEISSRTLTVTFTEGVTSHVLWGNVTDGLLDTQFSISFTVNPGPVDGDGGPEAFPTSWLLLLVVIALTMVAAILLVTRSKGGEGETGV
jgi:hypothetical protein